MDVSTPARPLSHQRPTQAYYVPRRILENGRGPQPTTTKPIDSEKESREPTIKTPSSGSKSPNKETNNNTNRNLKENKQSNVNSNNIINNNNNFNNNNSRSISPKQQKEQNNATKKNNSSRDSPQQHSPSQNSNENRRKPKTPPSRENVNAVDSTKENRPKPRTANQHTASPAAVPAVQHPVPIKAQAAITSKPPITRPNPFCPQALESKKDECICKRPDSHIICKRCGYEGTGRVQVVCLKHPMKLNLMDLRECPEPVCRSIQILELPYEASV